MTVRAPTSRLSPNCHYLHPGTYNQRKKERDDDDDCTQIAYAPAVKKIFVSDEHGGKDAVIDTANNKLVMNIPLGGGAGKRTTTTFGTMKSRSIISQEISCPSKR